MEGRLLLGEAKAEAKVVAAEDGGTAATAQHTAEPLALAPAAATEHAVRATAWACRIRLRTAAVNVIPILAPLPHVAAHVVEAQFVGLLLRHKMGH